MTTQQLLTILRRCSKLEIDDLNRWPQFLFQKDLSEMSEAEALLLLNHLDAQSIAEALFRRRSRPV